MRFRRAHHQRIAQVLKSLDSALLARHGCYFAGGTALALLHGEYRESNDIDFMVCEPSGYRELKECLQGDNGLAALAKRGAIVTPIGALRADAYGLRGKISSDGVAIKFEIIFEGRITFEAPDPADKICGIHTLGALDLTTGKLLANSDRWADPGVFSRDLIDLAMMSSSVETRQYAVKKAEGAYGKAILRDLEKAIDQFLNKTGWALRCTTAMDMSEPTASLMQRVVKLGRDVGLSVKLARR